MRNGLPTSGHSAEVHIHLYVHGQPLSVTHLGPDFLVLKEPIDHPPDDAEIELSIDGQVRRWAVNLVSGITTTQRKTPISPCAAGTRDILSRDTLKA